LQQHSQRKFAQHAGGSDPGAAVIGA